MILKHKHRRRQGSAETIREGVHQQPGPVPWIILQKSPGSFPGIRFFEFRGQSVETFQLQLSDEFEKLRSKLHVIETADDDTTGSRKYRKEKFVLDVHLFPRTRNSVSTISN
jgi:hypothetical protein